MAEVTEVSKNKMFGGWQKVFSHTSSELKCDMKFAIYLPPQTEDGIKVPVLYWLSGLTCTEQNFITKDCAQRHAARDGIIIVCPDTSPRGCNIEGEDDSYDFGTGAGFYVNATEEKWKTNYRMDAYVTQELPKLIKSKFPADPNKQSIIGHSAGGHGALALFLRNPGMYQSVSALAPICNPMACPWGQKAFEGYLGNDKETWKEYDACHLVRKYQGPPNEILIDQGTADNFLAEGQLLPDNFVAACAGSKMSVNLRMQEDYDHGHFFVSTFIGDHMKHHAKFLKK